MCYDVRRTLMQSARIWIAALAVTTGASLAGAQESQLDGLRAAARAAPNDAAPALALGRALRRAGHEQDAIQELRRGFHLPNGRMGDTAIALHWEIARAHMSLKDFGSAMVSCRVVGSLPGGAAGGHACAA